MHKILFAAAGAMLAATSVAQQPVAPANPAAPADQFGVRESVEQIDMSPDGRHVVYLQPGPGRSTYVYVSDLDGDAEARVVVHSDGDPERLRSCDFATNDRLICRITGASVTEGVPLGFSRLVAIDTTGQNLKLLGQRSSDNDARLRQYDGQIIDWSGGADGTILMSRDYVPEEGTTAMMNMQRTANGLGVDRIDIRTLRSTRVESPNRNAEGYIADGHGVVRIMSVQTTRGASEQLGAVTNYMYRAANDRDWHPLGSWNSETREGMIPLAVDAASDSAYVLKKLNGRFALYRVKLDASLASELVYANDIVDVDDVVTVNHGARVIGVTFAEEEQRVVYFDPDFAGLARALGRAIPNLPLIDFQATSADGSRVLIHAGSDSDPGRYYVYDRTAHNLNEIMLVRPQLENVPLASVRAVSYAAADGTMIPAYLTLPPGQASPHGLPAIVLPHGGPSARDTWGFDWLAQYLAHQGYAVLQPNYRGSAGYGDQWLQQNGFRNWRTSIGDITAGARWLAAQGIADPNRVGILGWSYGGYASLQAEATEPGLFRAVVAIAPVTDLQQAKDDAQGFTDERNVANFIGAGPHVADGSPDRHADAFTAPVLLFHGDRDMNVRVVHSQRMDQALRAAGKSSTLTIVPGLEHDLADSAVRSRMLAQIGAFLDTNLRHQ